MAVIITTMGTIIAHDKMLILDSFKLSGCLEKVKIFAISCYIYNNNSILSRFGYQVPVENEERSANAYSTHRKNLAGMYYIVSKSQFLVFLSPIFIISASSRCAQKKRLKRNLFLHLVVVCSNKKR